MKRKEVDEMVEGELKESNGKGIHRQVSAGMKGMRVEFSQWDQKERRNIQIPGIVVSEPMMIFNSGTEGWESYVTILCDDRFFTVAVYTLRLMKQPNDS